MTKYYTKSDNEIGTFFSICKSHLSWLIFVLNKSNTHKVLFDLYSSHLNCMAEAKTILSWTEFKRLWNGLLILTYKIILSDGHVDTLFRDSFI